MSIGRGVGVFPLVLVGDVVGHRGRQRWEDEADAEVEV
jgi:hypothetical protein